MSPTEQRSSSPSERQHLLKQALRVQRFLVGYNVIEGLVAISAGAAAGSIALTGFGLDSFIEVTAAGMLVWRLSHRGSVDEETAKEQRALRVVGITFLLLAGYVLCEAGSTLVHRRSPEASLIGILLAIASLIVMPLAAVRQRTLAKQLDSRALAADSVETIVCTYLSFMLLVGLGLNALWGWWWADPIAALAMVPLIVKEGWEAIHESREEAADERD